MKVMQGSKMLSKGFTLLEVLLVLTLLAGAGFVLLVKLPVQMENRNLSLASTQIVQDLREARTSALAEDVWYEIRFYESNDTYRIYREGSLVKNSSLPQKISFANRPSTVRFSAGGTTSFVGSPPLTGTISLTNGKSTRNVITALITGRVREEVK
ncbi:prepilin-type N-terminal cleavage/methylation domain-containing protein [Desulfitobacterium dichloroeliminans LMG P-21439]|uniref:Prepilin-type N-terminal cleavage/methylation domain-containing protein n=1 Tax=Desulfitobacterium dichloroeliminans (strain LMG P-21439 / DCA1) TaxID=871963 RepID=L0FAA9_DESDL|nr:prepilin-type N-terminal cleavage/methylation domain-containing protein [Desulfitobacterium dichloroeliminans]AGA69883.1 prepilin-type N-terminal cleavage/methylation domain-containing protein [Desulfitobacterium dichloroeliminans LMG P-21439]